MEFWPINEMPPTSDVPASLPASSEEYLISRAVQAVKKEAAVPSELPEVVNLARDYDRWDHYEAPPPLED